MNKSKQIFFLILLGCNLVLVGFERGDYSGSRTASLGSGGNWLSGIIGTAVGILGLSQSVNKHQDHHSHQPQEYSEYNDSNVQGLVSGREKENYPSWSEREIRENINKQRDLLRKTNIEYNNQRTALTGKHKKRIKKRFEAAQAFFDGKDSLRTKSYDLLPDARRVINKYADASRFETFSGYAIQQVLHKEYIDIVNAVPKIQNSAETARYVIPFADSGLACNKAGYIVYAFYFADFCWATIEGVRQGVYNTAQAFRHPINTAVGMSHGVVFLGKLLGAIGKEALDITTLACCDEKQFKVQGEMRLRQAAVLADGIKDAARKNPREAYKNTITFGTEWFLFGKCLSSFGKFADCVKPKLQNAITGLTRGTRPQYAFAGAYGNDIPLMEVLVDELGGLLHRAQEALGNTGDKIKATGRAVGEKVRKWVPGCSKINIHMQNLEKIIPQLEQMYNGMTVTIGHLKDLKLKFDFKHVFGVELKQVRGQTRLNGFHFDPLGILEKSGAIELVNVQCGPHGFYKALVKIEGQVLRPEKTFFPKNWDHYKVMECVTEALNNVKDIDDLGKGFYLVTGYSNQGIKVRAYLDEMGRVASWYPCF